MDDHTISIVKESFDLVEPIAPQAAELFYANLFEADASLEPIFRSSEVPQGAALMQMIERAISRLDKPTLMTPTLHDLGRRFAGAGVRSEQLDTVRRALLKTLYQGLGVAYTEEVEEAWTQVYGELVATMKEGVAETA